MCVDRSAGGAHVRCGADGIGHNGGYVVSALRAWLVFLFQRSRVLKLLVHHITYIIYHMAYIVCHTSYTTTHCAFLSNATTVLHVCHACGEKCTVVIF